MELRHMRFFVEVVRRGGFSAAAGALASTQSTVSKAIQQLEYDCGSPLLLRLPQGIKTTDAGELVFRRALSMLAEQERLEAELAAQRGLQTGWLRIGVPPIGSSVIFAPLIAEFRRRYPGIRMELREEGSHRLEEAVQCGEIEVGASLDPISEGLASQSVCDEPLMALIPASDALARREKIRFRELAGKACIFFEEGFALNALIDAACRRDGIKLVEATRSGQPEFIVALAAAGVGVAMLPRMMVPSLPKKKLRAVMIEDDDLRWRLSAVWRRNSPLSPPAEKWISLMAEFSSSGSGLRKK